MTNPPGWVNRRNCGGVQVMPEVQAGLVTAAQVNSQPSMGGAGMQIHNWSFIWFGLSVVYLVGVYYGMINIRSSAV